MDYNSKEIKKLVLDLFPLIILLCVTTSFFTSNWFKDWLGTLPDIIKFLLMGSILFYTFYYQYSRWRYSRKW